MAVPPLRLRGLPSRFTGDSRLRGMVLRMITLNTLGAFTQEISRRPPADAIAPAARPPATDGTRGFAADPIAASPQRTLEAAPSGPPPSKPLPRGSLLDLRV
jgi:hypothetical protein